MKKLAFSALALGAFFLSTAAGAESVEEMCVRVSEEWGTQGDVAAQCSCLADAAAGDSALESELYALGDKFSNDQEAYDGSSDSAKAAFDSCSVNS